MKQPKKKKLLDFERAYLDLAEGVMEAVLFVAAIDPDAFTHIKRQPASQMDADKIHQALHTLRFFAEDRARVVAQLKDRVESMRRENAELAKELCDLRPLLYRAGKRYLQELDKKSNG